MFDDLNDFNKHDLKGLNEEQLNNLAASIRNFLIESNSKTGGHIGANLGTVELSLAIHYVFDTPNDIVVWDTGHTGYTHKILTGRANLFSSLNTFGGMNRFVTSTESEHDFIEASHAGTSISVALGNALHKKNTSSTDYSIAVIGDGSLAEGLALEALNHASCEDVNLLIVINDNQYAISPGFGAIHNHLGQISSSKESNIFTNLGYNYHGVIDGHSSMDIIDSFNSIKNMGGVHIVHLKTEKGHGYLPAKDHPNKMHYSFPFDVVSGNPTETQSGKSFQSFAADAILDSMSTNSNIYAITPSTLYATDLEKVFKQFPERCFDPGMQEQHALSMAAGIARSGGYPIIFYQSTFLQRAYDQLVHDVCFSNDNVLILAVRSGFAGYDNPTHHGIYDQSYLKGIPNLKMFYPTNGDHLNAVIKEVIRNPIGPVCIFMPYGVEEKDTQISNIPIPSKLLESHEITSGNSCLIITTGNKVADCLEVSKILEADGLSLKVVNINKLKPLNIEYLSNLMQGFDYIFSIEENVGDGGLGESLSSIITKNSISSSITSFSLPNIFVQGGSTEELSALYELDAISVSNKIRNIINGK